jgi:hypothetical protein
VFSDRFDITWVQELSVSLWAMAKLAFHPGRSLKDIGLRIEELVQEFTPQACSNTLWALAVLQVWRYRILGVPNVLLPRCSSPGLASLQKGLVLSSITCRMWAGLYVGCQG